MAPEAPSTNNLDYLQRLFELPRIPKDAPVMFPPADHRLLLNITSVGRIEKPRLAASQSAPNTSPQPGSRAQFESESLLIGAYGHSIPIAFRVSGSRGRVEIDIGTWSGAADSSDDGVQRRLDVLSGMLDGLYSGVEVANGKPETLPMSMGGLVFGVPTTAPPVGPEMRLPIDRLLAALGKSEWQYLVLAEPMSDDEIRSVRHSLINELRAFQSGSQAVGGVNPLTEHYAELGKAALKNMTLGHSVGAWRTTVYLLGDAEGYPRLASVWRSVFSGENSIPEAVRVLDDPRAAELAVSWAIPDQRCTHEPPGYYRHPFEYQTVLNSQQLAAYVHLPNNETSGFSIRIVPDFDVVPPQPPSDNVIELGEVIHRTTPTGWPYQIDVNRLGRHTFVAGLTGSGKTNTIFHILKQAHATGVPFMVIEPAKTEYRALLADKTLAKDLLVFTLGNERISPLRLNPFEVLPGTPVSVHLDLLRAVFTASFGMWTPLPQVLEQCLHRIYEDRGWDITTDTNARLSENDLDRADAFPTLSDLVSKVDEVTMELGYEQKITDDLRAALRTRLNSLRSGGKGRMLDVRRSLPMDILLRQPAVLELEDMGDEDDKAFIIGLFLIRLAEFRRAAGEADSLMHLLVVEEAHRLLANVSQQQVEEQANPRGKAVETFTNLLSEIRAYGQGVIIADQVPVKLAPDVIKNTNLKIAHRLVASDDRAVLGGAMAMDERQQLSLATLTLGQAAIFSEGDDSPVLVKVPPAKGGNLQVSVSQVKESMTSTPHLSPYRDLYLPSGECSRMCSVKWSICGAAEKLVEQAPFEQTFARIVLSCLEDGAALDRMWQDIGAFLQMRHVEWPEREQLWRCSLVRAAHWFAQRRGAQAGWSYPDTARLADLLCAMLVDKLTDSADERSRSEFRDFAIQLHARPYPAYPACERICPQDPPVCLYRNAVADLVATGAYDRRWERAETMDLDNLVKEWSNTWFDAARDLIEFPEDDWPMTARERAKKAMDRVGLCFAQQMMAKDPGKSPRTVRRVLHGLLEEIGYA